MHCFSLKNMQQVYNYHVGFTAASYVPMMSAFNISSCDLSIHLLYVTLLMLELTANITHVHE